MIRGDNDVPAAPIVDPGSDGYSIILPLIVLPSPSQVRARATHCMPPQSMGKAAAI
ncbi:hypothetical protein Enr13x_67940 [Stieleria neptunia]|uniref:Uncharacterized protein n=1 Tax=Stieleria neptunia TaxID=2527979 RepID=A0A518I1B2_9BACT|nr:hypothetical protein Enr13x_67940 [Stieleria neptunia]